MKKWLVILALVTALSVMPAVVSADGLMEGDFNCDGRVSVLDVVGIMRYTVDPTGAAGVRLFEPTADNLLCGDVSDDGSVSIIDAVMILKWTVDPTGAAGVLKTPLWQSPADDGMLPPAP